MSKKIVIALPGGGIKSAFQLGFLKILLSSPRFKQFFTIDEINGVSGGSIVGAYACTGQLKELEDIYTSIRTKDDILHQWSEIPCVGYYASMAYALISKRGFYRKDKMMDMFLNPLNLEGKSKGCVGMSKYNCVAVNLEQKAHKYINGTTPEIKKYITASASLPFVFEPEEINGEHYCDGGIFELYPLGSNQTNIDAEDYEGIDNDKYYLVIDLQKYALDKNGKPSKYLDNSFIGLNMVDYLINIMSTMAEEIAYSDIHQYQIFNKPNIFYIPYPCEDKMVCQDTFDISPYKISHTIRMGEQAAAKFLDDIPQILQNPKKISKKLNPKKSQK